MRLCTMYYVVPRFATLVVWITLNNVECMIPSYVPRKYRQTRYCGVETCSPQFELAFCTHRALCGQAKKGLRCSGDYICISRTKI
ncbi:hypothetical protein F5Y11DRAFT_335510 [Daldinia sp. FL1419]|nr:hypothetical protein F5Y11DRAFT_335510 [Daldinia sp. FL1419]